MSENTPSIGSAVANPKTNGRLAANGSVDGLFTPLLTTCDWGAEWVELQKHRRVADDAAFWDKRSATFTTKDAPNPYVERFLELARIRPGETVFDMGCGTGALTVPLAGAGHPVVAADFSGGMLDVLRQNLKQAHAAAPVNIVQMSWSDRWQDFGVGPASADVALASRSIVTADIRDSLLRLTDVARRRVCITLSTGASPRADDELLAELGLMGRNGRDFLYAFNILANEGIKPEVSYIDSLRDSTFNSREEARESYVRMIDSALGAEPDAGTAAYAAFEAERTRACRTLDEWLDVHLLHNPDAGKPDRKGVPQGALKVDRPRIISWAFISWDK